MKLYEINRWGELFENNRSRTVKDLDWVSIPNRHDGENYTKLITHEDGAILFAAWNLLVQVASKCKIRGVLIKDDGKPHNSLSLSLKTRAQKAWFDKAFKFLEVETDWLLVNDVPDDYQHPVSLPSADCEEGKGREGKEGKGNIGDFPKEIEFWNSNCGTLSKVVSASSDRMAKLRARRQDKFWVSNFEAATIRAASSDFCCGRIKGSAWLAGFDWMLQPNVVAKIMEGKYDNRNGAASGPAEKQKIPTREEVYEYAKTKGDKAGFAISFYSRWAGRNFQLRGKNIDWKIQFSEEFAKQR